MSMKSTLIIWCSPSMDIRDEKAVQILFADIRLTFRTADVLINDAGSGKSAPPINDTEVADFWRAFVRSQSEGNPPHDPIIPQISRKHEARNNHQHTCREKDREMKQDSPSFTGLALSLASR
ncbi:uncharacterized protein RSE6_04850 [Rhynchosporium secalis]|uniref:Uncharacterized protein n=1 Tax=Rhynchosporium secalis TaxID=38038 RepID=A0A1E1M6C1_RHYSE|nr:uncharacterized protein RSE6_04850 [Rhynchosporium secalis]